MDIQVRVQASKGFYRRSNYSQGIFDSGGDTQGAFELGMFTAGFFYRQAGLFKHARAAQVEALTRVGQCQLAGVAGQQGDAEFRLQALEVEADHGAGLAEQIRGRGERTGLDHGLEGVKTVQADHGGRPPLSKYF